MVIDIVVVLPLWGCIYPSFYMQGGRGYKKGNRVSYDMIPIRNLSLLAYFTYIIIVLLSMPWEAHHGPQNLLDGGQSHNRHLLGPFESTRGGTLGTTLRQQPRVLGK
jgi:hypothetical protein